MRYGTSEPDTYKLGASDVDKLYLGADLVWSPAAPPSGNTWGPHGIFDGGSIWATNPNLSAGDDLFDQFTMTSILATVGSKIEVTFSTIQDMYDFVAAVDTFTVGSTDLKITDGAFLENGVKVSWSNADGIAATNEGTGQTTISGSWTAASRTNWDEYSTLEIVTPDMNFNGGGSTANYLLPNGPYNNDWLDFQGKTIANPITLIAPYGTVSVTQGGDNFGVRGGFTDVGNKSYIAMYQKNGTGAYGSFDAEGWVVYASEAVVGSYEGGRHTYAPIEAQPWVLSDRDWNESSGAAFSGASAGNGSKLIFFDGYTSGDVLSWTTP